MPIIKILLLEDAASVDSILERMAETLPPERYAVTRLTDWADGLAAVRNTEYDVCLLADQPGTAALGFLGELCASECVVPVLVVTHTPDEVTAWAMMEAGASAYLATGELACLERALRYARHAKQMTAQRLRLAQDAHQESWAHLAHELRTPLNALLGWVKLLRSGKLDDKTFARGLENIEDSARTQARLIQEGMSEGMKDEG